MSDLLIKNGLVVTETGEAKADILVRGGKIAAIGSGLRPGGGACETIDAAGRIVIPGGVDVHTHLCLDTGAAVACDDFYTGTIAAACGGTTTIVDHPGFGPAGCDLGCQIAKYHALARGRAVIDYGFHGVIQHVDGAVLARMEDLAREGITSYKIYLTYAYKISDEGAFQVFEKAKDLGVTVTVHCENDGLINLLRDRFGAEGKLSPRWHPRSRPPEAEAEAVYRMIMLARAAGDAPLYVVHLSSALALEAVRAAKERGQKNLWTETCPQYLLLDESRYDLPDNEGLKYVMCPPLRTKNDQEALWEALADGVIDTVATDHCPFFFQTQKIAGKDDFRTCPSGAGGVEERLALLYSEGVAKGRISLRRFVELCSTNPAKRFGMYPQKGVLREGADADITIIDPAQTWTVTRAALHGNGDYSAYEGFDVKGRPVITISRGDVIARDGAFSGEAGRGRFVTRTV